MNKLVAGSIAIAMFLIAGCGERGPKLVSGAEDIAGAWHRTSGFPWYIAFHEDGTMNAEGALEPVVEGRGHDERNFRLEGTQLILEGSHHCEEEGQQIGIYEVHLLENGNLQFVAIEDECAGQGSELAGLSDEGITWEWEPVP